MRPTAGSALAVGNTHCLACALQLGFEWSWPVQARPWPVLARGLVWRHGATVGCRDVGGALERTEGWDPLPHFAAGH